MWQARPLLEELLHYAAADVRYLHLLADSLNKLLPPTIVQKVGVRMDGQPVLRLPSPFVAVSSLVIVSPIRPLYRSRPYPPPAACPPTCQVRNATMARTRTGDLPGVPRSSAPDLVRPSDVRQLALQHQMRQVERGDG